MVKLPCYVTDSEITVRLQTVRLPCYVTDSEITVRLQTVRLPCVVTDSEKSNNYSDTLPKYFKAHGWI